MLIEVYGRPEIIRFFHYTGDNSNEFVEYLNDVHLEATVNSDFSVVITNYPPVDIHVLAGDYVSANATQWGTQMVVRKPAEMDQWYYPVTTLPPVTAN